MELHQIETYIDSPDPQNRMKAITELRNYEPDLVVPLLKRRMCDQELIIRSFVAMGLGYKRTDEGFELLLDLIEHDRDYNVRAEAANSLAKYGAEAIQHLVQLFRQDPNWLVRYSIFAAIDLTNNPEILLELIVLALKGEDLVVRQTAIANLEQLANTPQKSIALELLLSAAKSDQGTIRAQVAKVLRHFEDPDAETALMNLRQDSDYRVVAATLEGLV
ncbi:HEAT repeat domain-containing protein [Pleurocapsa sp. PCC 7319]|uniref:HEAT repeat domain-containing protein n=1 Tax=Pleurocapsa sp. PCC 7319 TaxID=118161 RepID=UPI00034984D5|nr:HEAT repeat domain-containing protein [Pleurocapsa sp. PCC 7319]